MKKIFLALSVCILFFSCQKTVESVVDDILVQAMTSGKWKINNFTKNGVDFTSNFTGYQFQFNNNKTVDAIKSGTVEKTGTWDGNATAMTTSANFPSATYPLVLINGTWNVVNTGSTYIVVTQTNGSEIKTMRLDKL